MSLWRTLTTLGAVASTGVLGPLAVLKGRRDPRDSDPVIRGWARNILAAAGVELVVEGLERLPARTVVLVSNHQSLFDPLAVLAALPRHVRFVAKADLLKVPVFGYALRATGNVPVDRTGSERDKDALQGAVDAVRERVSLLFYPEGTRSPDGNLMAFKKGAAVLALSAQVPLVPLGCWGTRDVLPKGSLHVRGGRKVALVVGEPLLTEGRSLEERDALTHEAQQAVETALVRARQLAA